MQLSFFFKLFHEIIGQYDLYSTCFHIVKYTTKYYSIIAKEINIKTIRVFLPNMNDKGQNKQIDELKELSQKNLSEKAKKAIDKKIKGIQKPFTK